MQAHVAIDRFLVVATRVTIAYRPRKGNKTKVSEVRGKISNVRGDERPARRARDTSENLIGKKIYRVGRGRASAAVADTLGDLPARAATRRRRKTTRTRILVV